MNYVNNWLRPITLGAADTSAALDLPDGSYRLCISDASGALFEVVDAVAVSGTATLTRGLEGTTAQEWPAGSSIYCSVTAGMLAGFGGSEPLRGNGSPAGVVLAPAGAHYIDDEYFELWFCVDSGVYEGVEFSDWHKVQFAAGAPLISIGLGFNGGAAVPVTEGIMAAGGVAEFGLGVGTIHTNATLTTVGSSRKLPASASPYYYKVWGDDDGSMFFMTTPLTVSEPPAP
ncbi:hypothetical protein [uncultured Pseudomonas sp.]|uniref:hypothetical protein n=1 Tax=uncultured Pseudomonas sp. TaxID=114707 RepID=UPI00262166E0|nr:hypothetical protein [uncultured Pseudomonas sp.]